MPERELRQAREKLAVMNATRTHMETLRSATAADLHAASNAAKRQEDLVAKLEAEND